MSSRPAEPVGPRALRGPLAVAAAAATALVTVALVDPNEPGHYPACPFLTLTGYFCPGCGSLRAVHALTHGHLAEAIGLNALLVLVALPLTIAAVAGWSGRRLRRTPRRSPSWSAARLWGLLAVAAAFGLLRNLPVGAALTP